MTDYSFETQIDVRFRDLDAMGHVNNAVYATYMEEARTAYFAAVVDRNLSETPSVLANLELQFRQSVTLGDDLTVAVRVPELGESSIPMEYEMRVDGEVAATGEAVQVVIDPDTESSRPIPEEWREKIEAYEGL
ncbi:acyl-CoA thioesterase [Halorussus marinus]|uniref:acyl-CoA thioesterase n=1 Tax=Halorussus marinus TaxID=2505976 RepID=UPI00106E84F6|nr:thioesterase family protein [Halorussus marinus]